MLEDQDNKYLPQGRKTDDNIQIDKYGINYNNNKNNKNNNSNNNNNNNNKNNPLTVIILSLSEDAKNDK